jgi:methyltransferase
MDLSAKIYLALLVIVGLGRLGELAISRRHQKQMALRGIAKRADPGFRWMVAFHAAVLAGAAVEVVALRRPFFPVLGLMMALLFVMATGLRWWVIGVMGEHWNVEVMASGAMGVVTGGPYRFVRHPNYLAVFVEMAALPLIHTAWVTSFAAMIGNIFVLRHRLGIEEPILNAEPAYRTAMASKPRFLPGLF